MTLSPQESIGPNYQFYVCNHKEFAHDYSQKMDNVAQLPIIDDKKKIRKKFVAVILIKVL